MSGNSLLSADWTITRRATEKRRTSYSGFNTPPPTTSRLVPETLIRRKRYRVCSQRSEERSLPRGIWWGVWLLTQTVFLDFDWRRDLWPNTERRLCSWVESRKEFCAEKWRFQALSTRAFIQSLRSSFEMKWEVSTKIFDSTELQTRQSKSSKKSNPLPTTAFLFFFGPPGWASGNTFETFRNTLRATCSRGAFIWKYKGNLIPAGKL